jgi:hypothetical protein
MLATLAYTVPTQAHTERSGGHVQIPKERLGFVQGGVADVSAVGLRSAWRLAAVWRESSPAGGVQKATPFPPPPARSVWVHPSIFPPFFLEEVYR